MKKVILTQYTKIADIYIKLEKFLNFYKKQDNGCIAYTGLTQKQNYGFVGVLHEQNNQLTRKMMTAHRIVMMIKLNRPLQKGENVIHTCSNPNCVNPEHLFIGTLKDRSRIAIQNNRFPKTRNRKKKNV